eukprot:TRINITY_DN284_c0_g1_i1.p1 TRINITY_DN284_c0_g1~~TRINITY_DN284_c0_g1_i1.p1  ORF type:complete len:124 (-),score=8.13 TRINITY_DN284_c0_g1_i1:171-542(-)
MIRRPPRSTLSSSSAASDVYKRQVQHQRAPEVRELQQLHGPRGSVLVHQLVHRTDLVRAVPALEFGPSDQIVVSEVHAADGAPHSVHARLNHGALVDMGGAWDSRASSLECGHGLSWVPRTLR